MPRGEMKEEELLAKQRCPQEKQMSGAESLPSSEAPELQGRAFDSSGVSSSLMVVPIPLSTG